MQHVGCAVVEALDLTITRHAANVIIAGGKLLGRSRDGEWGDNAEAVFVETVAVLRGALELNSLGDEERRQEKLACFTHWAQQQTAVGPYALGAVPYPGVAKLIEECGELVHDLANPELGSEALHIESADVLAACDFFIRWHDEQKAAHILQCTLPELSTGVRFTGTVAHCARCGRDWTIRHATEPDVLELLRRVKSERCVANG